MDSALIRWSTKRQFVGTDASGRSTVMDTAPEWGGEGSGIRPVELVLHALAGCTATDVISILEKKRQDVRSLEVTIKGHQRAEEQPKIYDRIEIHYRFGGFGLSEPAVLRAIELSQEKYCAVRGMLIDGVEISWTYAIEESREAGRGVLEGDGEE